MRLVHEQQLGQRRLARIADIVAAIETNAVQTHLIALQAAMEASREGERGRGVQLIGNEVRVLSQRCRYAARQLRELLAVPHALPLVSPHAAARLPEESAAADLPALATLLQDQLAESAAAARQLQQGAGEASSAVSALAERLASLDGGLQAQGRGPGLSPDLQEALRIEVEQVRDALSVFYLGIDTPALGSAVAPAEASPPAAPPPAPRRRARESDEAGGRLLRADPFLTH